jgi:hypothetical protein
MNYQQFVKAHMQKMKNSRMTPQAKMAKIAQMWRSSGHKTATKGRKPAKATKGRRGKGLMLAGGSAVHLENGVPLHPEMMGSGFWKDFKRGFKMPFQALARVANSDAGKATLAVAPFLL